MCKLLTVASVSRTAAITFQGTSSNFCRKSFKSSTIIDTTISEMWNVVNFRDLKPILKYFRFEHPQTYNQVAFAWKWKIICSMRNTTNYSDGFILKLPLKRLNQRFLRQVKSTNLIDPHKMMALVLHCACGYLLIAELVEIQPNRSLLWLWKFTLLPSEFTAGWLWTAGNEFDESITRHTQKPQIEMIVILNIQK